MCPDFVRKLDELRELCGFPIIITSGYRSPEWNEIVSTTGRNGAHTTGRAADIRCSGAKAYRVLEAAMQLGFTGIGVSQKGPHGMRFIHLDMLSEGRPWVWSY